jgi:hypothetical protein
LLEHFVVNFCSIILCSETGQRLPGGWTKVSWRLDKG